jgi:hypothetical protein
MYSVCFKKDFAKRFHPSTFDILRFVFLIWCSFTQASPNQPNRETRFSPDFPSPDKGDDSESLLDKGRLSTIFNGDQKKPF